MKVVRFPVGKLTHVDVYLNDILIIQKDLSEPIPANGVIGIHGNGDVGRTGILVGMKVFVR